MPDFLANFESLQKQAKDRFDNKIDINESATYIPNPGVSILFFLIITTVLLIIKIFILPSKLDDFKQESSVIKIVFIVYILLLLAGNFLINLSITTELCNGTSQWGTTFLITFIPWIIIFGIINIILIIFPGWLVPFSNTFGYFIITLFGIKDLFNKKIINGKNKYGNVDNNIIDTSGIVLATALQQIYGNESILINEIPRVGNNEEERLDSFKDFYETMKKLKIFKDNSDDEIKVQLYKLLIIKDYIAEYVWYILTGILVSSITYNYIVNVGCSFSSLQMSKQYNEYINKDLSDRNINNVSKNMEASQELIMD